MLGEILAELRKDAGFSQTALAAILNTDRSTIGKYEHDKTLPSVETLCKIADLFNVNLDYLLGRTRVRKSCNDFKQLLSKYNIESLEKIIDGVSSLRPIHQEALQVVYISMKKQERTEKILHRLEAKTKQSKE